MSLLDNHGMDQGEPVIKTGIPILDAIISFGAAIIVPIGKVIVSVLNSVFPKK